MRMEQRGATRREGREVQLDRIIEPATKVLEATFCATVRTKMGIISVLDLILSIMVIKINSICSLSPNIDRPTARVPSGT